jgi:GAF domain-containing protein
MLPMPTRATPGTSVPDALTYPRLHALLDAHRVITSDLTLPTMLDRLVAAACELVGVPGGLLGVLDDEDGFAHVIRYGATDTAVDDLTDASPRTLAESPRPVRIDPAVRVGGQAPEDRPPNAGLAVPVRVRGEAFGLIYLPEPSGRLFDTADEELLAAFAAAAGTAIENARLYEDARRSRDWLNASGEIARALLADADEDTLLDVVSRALFVAEADYGSLILPTADGRLEVAVVVGLGADDWRGHVFDPQNSEVGQAIAHGESRLIRDLPELAAPGYQNIHHYGPAMIAPLIDAQGVRGAVLLIRAAGRERFTATDLDLASTFADQVALAFQLNDARADAEALRALQDRHRIARELHDHVMQRLFAIGVGLDGLMQGQLPDDTRERVRAYVRELDETIEEIRARVFGLRSGTPPRVPRGHHYLPRPASR